MFFFQIIYQCSDTLLQILHFGVVLFNNRHRNNGALEVGKTTDFAFRTFRPDGSVAGLLLKQILIGAACGFLIGKASVFILNQIDFGMKQGRTIFLFAAVIVGYALPSVAGGNGYLSVYLCGILIGNRFIPDKKEMVHFFDILTEIAQMVIFFLLGLLVTPSQLPEVFVPALLLCLFMPS